MFLNKKICDKMETQVAVEGGRSVVWDNKLLKNLKLKQKFYTLF